MAMARGRSFALFLVLSLVANALCGPHITYRQRRALADNKLDSKNTKDISKNHSSDSSSSTSSTTTVALDEDKSLDDDDDDDFGDDHLNSSPSTGGSNIFSLLNLASALFPASGSSNDGDSDLGSLLATVGGIVANLSGDGIDLNALIATGLGLFVGLLSEGEQNPGEIIASYLLTSLDTITGGGAKNNGAFFGKFLSKLVKGTSAAGDPDDDSGSGSDENKMTMADSAGFFASLLMALLGEMSKTSSGSSWR